MHLYRDEESVITSYYCKSYFQVDLQNAYDSVEWNFLTAVLKLFRFPSKFIGWILECVTIASYSISLNGVIAGFFSGARGLRQRALSRNLFALVIEVLNLLLKDSIANGSLFSYHWKCDELKLVMLCFADDLLLFCKVDVGSTSMFKEILELFLELSELTANPAKSQIIFSAAAVNAKESILQLFGFHEGRLPLKCLGLPLVAYRLSVAHCHPLISKVDQRIASWGALTLSSAARAQLLKLEMESLCIYWGTAFILPKGVIRTIESRFRSFLWKDGSGRGYAKVSWEQVCSSKEQGGLGLTNITAMNKALISRHLWMLIATHDRWAVGRGFGFGRTPGIKPGS
ncbi:UNVERIFIED_CONTAM: hypothetical protein Sradi_1583200 [Sesamum radiatum]|uniref:Reverse transcriptase domain-containing protein n=1 Tax=Sesamum radiatum TaxID=300843 RepID=A0AAW2U975_SESRA